MRGGTSSVRRMRATSWSQRAGPSSACIAHTRLGKTPCCSRLSTSLCRPSGSRNSASSLKKRKTGCSVRKASRRPSIRLPLSRSSLEFTSCLGLRRNDQPSGSDVRGSMAEHVASMPAVPLTFKLVYTFFVAVLIPVYWRTYGPGNFLWFSDLALFLPLAAVWLESPLLASMQAVSVGLLELVWVADFVVRLVFRIELVGLTRYMFDPKFPLPVRGLSLFHIGLPILLMGLVYRLGYDPRAWLMQTLLAWVVLPVCYLLTRPADNVNWVFGPAKKR